MLLSFKPYPIESNRIPGRRNSTLRIKKKTETVLVPIFFWNLEEEGLGGI
jgi:hypothetical protein